LKLLGADDQSDLKGFAAIFFSKSSIMNFHYLGFIGLISEMDFQK